MNLLQTHREGRVMRDFSSRWRGKCGGFTLIEMLVVICIISLLIGLVLSAIQKVREAAARAQCQNNLKQIGLAAVSYHDSNDSFPTINTLSPGGSSWDGTVFVTLFPYLEQQALYQSFMVGNYYEATATPLSV